MDIRVLEYLKTQRVGVFAIEMMDGSPHAATVHFAHTDDPFVLYFETNKEYRKAEPLFGREQSRSTFVIGVDEGSPKTLQLDGYAELMKPEDRSIFDDVYLSKFPEKKKKAEDNKIIFFKFVPTWWRFSDFSLPEGKLIIGTDYKN